MRKVLAILLSALAVLTAAAQGPADDTLGFDARFERVNKAYAKTPEAVDALFDMAMLYFDNSLPLRNLPMAMSFAKRAEFNYLVLMNDNRHSELTRLMRRGIVLATVTQLTTAVRDAAYNTLTLHNDISLADLDAYLDVFANDQEITDLARQRRIQKDFESDMLVATPQAYYHIVETYPHTDEAIQAEAMLGKVGASLFEGIDNAAAIDSVVARYSASPSVTRIAARLKGRMAFAEANSINTIAAYKDYLRQYPSSDESMQARERLDALLQMQFNALHTAKEYADFADSNADNSLADDALVQIRRIIVQNRDVQAARMYLERYRLDPHYNEIYTTYYNWYAEEGNGDLLTRFEEENPDSPLAYALERDMERASIIDNIDLMEPYTEAEFHTYSTHIHQTMGKKISFVPLQRMLQQLTAAGDYQTARNRMNQFEICFDDVMHDEYVELQEILTAPSSGLTGVQFPVGGDVLNPCLNASDGLLYFTRIIDGERHICYATTDMENDGRVEFTNDQNTNLSLFGFFDGGEKMLLGSDGDIWIAEREGNGWRVSDILPYPVNTDYIETDAFMLPDGSGMLLASDRPGGQNLQQSGSYFHGDTAMAADLYFIPYRNGLWGNAVNLGNVINTPYCERSPIMSSDLRTLYFITDSRGMGYGDIYTSTRTSVESWTAWSKPQNMGREINTCFAEASVSLSPDERQIIISSNAEGRYACRMIPLVQAAVQANLNYSLDVLGMENELFRVRVADVSRQVVTQVVEYDGQGPEISLEIHKDKRYVIYGDAANYFIPAIIVAPGRTPQRLQGYSFASLVALDKSVPLEAVGFEPSSSALTPVALLQIEQLARFMAKNPTAIAEIGVDVAGIDDVLAYSLSLERGRAIKDRLEELGIEHNRVIISAYGNVNTKQGANEGVTLRMRS